METIRFNEVDVRVPFLRRRETRISLSAVLKTLGFEPGSINYIFCSDAYLLEINRKFLRHDTYTDIITFDYSCAPFLDDGFPFQSEGDGSGVPRLSGDIYISIPRVKENAGRFHVKHIDELNRVLVHGLLHLAGYEDKRPEEERKMHEMEDEMLSSCFPGYEHLKRK